MSTPNYYQALARFDASKGSFDQWQRICRGNARREEFRAKLKEAARQAVTRSIDSDDDLGEALLATDQRSDTERFIDKIDVALAFERAPDFIWFALLGIVAGFSLTEVAKRLRVPRSSLRRTLVEFGKEVRHAG